MGPPINSGLLCPFTLTSLPALQKYGSNFYLVRVTRVITCSPAGLNPIFVSS